MPDDRSEFNTRTDATVSDTTDKPGERVRTDKDTPDANPDAITGAPGSHPIGTGVGAAAAGAAGAAIGMAAGPVGSAVGAVVGAVAGGLAGKGVAEAVNPTSEDAYWREAYHTRPYYEAGFDYEHYGPAYTYGYTNYERYKGRSFEEVEPDLRTRWESARGKSRLDWDRAKHAVRDAWHRVERKLPGDFDKDKR